MSEEKLTNPVMTPSRPSLVNLQPSLLQELDLVSAPYISSAGLASEGASPSSGRFNPIPHHSNHFAEKEIFICTVILISL